MASLSILNHPVVCAVVSALSLELSQLGRDDAGTGADSRPHDCLPMGPDLRSRIGQEMLIALAPHQRLMASG